MFSHKHYAQEEIDQMLEQRLAAFGISPNALNQEVGNGTLRQLVCDLIAETLEQVDLDTRKTLYARQQAGRSFAKKNGTTFGRPTKRCSEKRFAKIRALYESHEISAEEAAQRLHVSISTFYRWLREAREIKD